MHAGIGQALLFGPHDHGVAGAGDITAQQQLLVQFFPGAQANKLDIDMFAHMSVVVHLITTQAYHAARQVNYAHRFTHIQHKDIPAGTHGTGLQYQLRGLCNAHEIAGHFRVGHGHRAAVGDLLAKQGDHGAG